MNKIVSIIIRTYNEDKHIRKLLDSLYNQDFPQDNMEVVVVDSGSTDDTLQIINNYPVRLVKIKPENFTFGSSLNKGIAEANGKYILLISAHCYPMNNYWISRMILPLEKNENIALVYGKQRGKNTTKFSEHQIFKKWFPEDDSGKQHYPFCNNANAAIRKKLWNEYQYNEKLTGLEDLDWANHLLEKGYVIYYQPKAGIYHIHEETFGQIFNRYKREAIALNNIFNDISFSFMDFIVMFFSNVFTDFHQSIKDSCFLKNIYSIILFRFNQFWGTYKGHKYNKRVDKKLKRKFYYPRKVSSKDNKKDYIGFIRFLKKLPRLIKRN